MLISRTDPFTILMPPGTNYNYGDSNINEEWLQTILPPYYSGYIISDGGVSDTKINYDTNIYALDTALPYGFSPSFPWPDADDSPFVPIINLDFKYVVVNQNSEMWLMFKPDGGNWVPLRFVPWYCYGSATNVG